jgi:hypothetical protein
VEHRHERREMGRTRVRGDADEGKEERESRTAMMGLLSGDGILPASWVRSPPWADSPVMRHVIFVSAVVFDLCIHSRTRIMILYALLL